MQHDGAYGWSVVCKLMDVGMCNSELGHEHDPVSFPCSCQSAYHGLQVVDLAKHCVFELPA